VALVGTAEEEADLVFDDVALGGGWDWVWHWRRRYSGGIVRVQMTGGWRESRGWLR
jgi:hypothetical protein